MGADIAERQLRAKGLNRSRGRRCGARFAHYLDGNVLSEDGVGKPHMRHDRRDAFRRRDALI